MNSTTIQIRIDKQTKKKAQKTLNTLGITMSEAVKLFLRQVALHKGIPFDVKIPNELTEKTLRDSEAGKNLHRAGSIDKLFRELDS